jgi:hypothetical protein
MIYLNSEFIEYSLNSQILTDSPKLVVDIQVIDFIFIPLFHHYFEGQLKYLFWADFRGIRHRCEAEVRFF